MVVLEKKFYSLAEMKKLMDTKRKETITNNLTKWGYHYEWIPYKGVNIINTPNSGNPEEQLKSLLVNKLDLDVQTDFKAFAAFFYKIMDDELFLTTPWETRARILKDEFNIEISDRVLRKYNAKLVSKGMMVKDDSTFEYWYTTYVCDQKVQDVVWESRDEDVEAMQDWFNKRKEYLEQADVEYQKAVGEADSLNPNRWKIALNKLWDETKTVYYKVKGWSFNAFEDKDIQEIYRLSALVIADIEPEEIEEIIEEKVEYNPLDACTGADGSFVF